MKKAALLSRWLMWEKRKKTAKSVPLKPNKGWKIKNRVKHRINEI